MRLGTRSKYPRKPIEPWSKKLNKTGLEGFGSVSPAFGERPGFCHGSIPLRGEQAALAKFLLIDREFSLDEHIHHVVERALRVCLPCPDYAVVPVFGHSYLLRFGLCHEHNVPPLSAKRKIYTKCTYLYLTSQYCALIISTSKYRGPTMPESKISTYADLTAAYLETPRGRANFRESRERFGYGYQRALCVAVMVACKLRIYERITAVVEELMRLDVAA